MGTSPQTARVCKKIVFEAVQKNMNFEKFREYCLSKKNVTECFPFDETTLVFKVMGKMFAMTSLDEEPSANLKCDPEKAIELRERYSCVHPGYHMNKQHWNTIYFDCSVPDKIFYEWVDHSYNLVVEKLPKRDRDKILQRQ